MFRLDREQSRRDFVRMSAAGAFAATSTGWLEVLASHAAEKGAVVPKGRVRQVVVLWMDGGPSHKDTFDLKPDSKGAGDFKPISTSAPGVQISEHFPLLAKQMHLGAIVRGMSTPEGAHARAKYNAHTGYREGQGGLTYPALGAIVSQEIGKKDFPAPNYVTIGGRSYGAGFLGPKHQPLIVADASRGVEDLRSTISTGQFDKRVDLLQSMERAFQSDYQADSINDHRTTYERAVRLMQSKEAKAFDISGETAETKAAYGSGRFGEGCLMARRLIEIGVPFVEVALGGWDTHQDNFTKVKNLSGQVDPAMSSLIGDLKSRGLLDSTLIVWMGEFGRTPNINTRGDKPGRDHFPKAWSLVMMGGGIKGGQAIGRTDKEGATVEEGKTTAVDFMATVCELMGIDTAKENIAGNSRPIRTVDKTAVAIKGIVG